MVSPISSFLPQAYQNNEVVQWVFQYLDVAVNAFEIESNQFVLDYLMIDSATSEGLDFIAGLNGVTALFWSKSWTVAQKRMLLNNYAKIISERGNRDLVQWLLNVFEYDALLYQDSGWILDQTAFNVTFSGDIFDYKLRIAAKYSLGTPERTTINKIVDTFIPAFVNVQIIEI